MRKIQEIDLGEGRTVTVRELRLKDLTKAMSLLPKDIASVSIMSFFLEKVPELLAVFEGENIILSEGKIEDLALSEIELVWEGISSLNPKFFGVLKALPGVAEARGALQVS